jgi:hypothetical protein
MAKKHPTAPAGPSGKPGAAGREGRPLPKSAHRVKGAPGAPGGTPDQTLPSTHVQLLEVVETQIEDIYQVLDVQVRRFAQIQLQVDELRGKVHQLLEKVMFPS